MLFLLVSAVRAAPFTLVVEHLQSDGAVICSLFASEADWLGPSPFRSADARFRIQYNPAIGLSTTGL